MRWGGEIVLDAEADGGEACGGVGISTGVVDEHFVGCEVESPWPFSPH